MRGKPSNGTTLEDLESEVFFQIQQTIPYERGIPQWLTIQISHEPNFCISMCAYIVAALFGERNTKEERLRREFSLARSAALKDR